MNRYTCIQFVGENNDNSRNWFYADFLAYTPIPTYITMKLLKLETDAAIWEVGQLLGGN